MSRLEQAQRGLPGIHAFQSDVSNTRAIPLLFNAVIEKFPALNMLINNVGIMREVNLLDQGTGLEDIGHEIATNLIGTIASGAKDVFMAGVPVIGQASTAEGIETL